MFMTHIMLSDCSLFVPLSHDSTSAAVYIHVIDFISGWRVLKAHKFIGCWVCRLKHRSAPWECNECHYSLLTFRFLIFHHNVQIWVCVLCWIPPFYRWPPGIHRWLQIVATDEAILALQGFSQSAPTKMKGASRLAALEMPANSMSRGIVPNYFRFTKSNSLSNILDIKYEKNL